jgi:hypothetical protein
MKNIPALLLTGALMVLCPAHAGPYQGSAGAVKGPMKRAKITSRGPNEHMPPVIPPPALLRIQAAGLPKTRPPL